MEVLDEGEPATIQLIRHPRGECYFLELLDRRPTDRWERVRRNALLSHYAYLGLTLLSGAPILLEPTEPLFPRAEDCYSCLTGLVSALLENWDEGASAHADRIAAWLPGPRRYATKPSPRASRPTSHSSRAVSPS